MVAALATGVVKDKVKAKNNPIDRRKAALVIKHFLLGISSFKIKKAPFLKVFYIKKGSPFYFPIIFSIPNAIWGNCG